MIFADAAHLFLPAEDPSAGRVVEAPADWTVGDLPDADVIVWGRAFSSFGTPAAAARLAAARERAIRAVRRRAGERGLRVRAVHRWRPARTRPGRAKHRVRAAVAAGVVMELAREPVQRVLDACVSAAGAEDPSGLRLVSAGAAIARARVRGEDAVVRFSLEGAGADPYPGAEALERLAAEGLSLAPRGLGAGRIAGATWTAESWLPGSRPERLTDPLARDAVEFAVALPRADGPPQAWRDDLAGIARVAPHLRGRLDDLAAAIDPLLSSMPAVLRHSDLWTGNLLETGGRLSGVVDWDGWRAAGVPGTDLVHLFATDHAPGRRIGDVWAARPWRSERFRSLTAAYWERVGIDPDQRLLDAVGAAWWASRIPEVLLGEPERVQDPRWAGPNVEAVLAAAP